MSCVCLLIVNNWENSQNDIIDKIFFFSLTKIKVGLDSPGKALLKQAAGQYSSLNYAFCTIRN